MAKMFSTIAIIMLFTAVQSLDPLKQSAINMRREERNVGNIAQFLKTLADIGRRVNPAGLAKARGMYDMLTKNKLPKKVKKWLREDKDVSERLVDEVGDGEREDILEEQELKEVLALKQSALLDRPYVEKKGQNDFLVMRPDILDPFVTVIPNAIYYNIEKKCVNWMDDCSLKGIRARLLRGVQSPYK